MARSAASSPGDERFDALITVLGEYISHHVEEEEGEMLPRLKQNGVDVSALGQEFEARKAELMTELGMGADETNGEDEDEDEDDDDDDEEDDEEGEDTEEDEGTGRPRGTRATRAISKRR